VIYSVKQKLKKEFIGLPGSEIKQLRLSGVQVCVCCSLSGGCGVQIEPWFTIVVVAC
jgi:hypothetical protein